MKITRRLGTITLAAVLAIGFLGISPFRAAAQGASSEASIQGQIEAKLKQEGLLTGSEIQVTVENKAVTLTGTVRTLAQKEQAGRNAQSVAKGYKIINNITLAAAGLSAQQIAEGIIAAIEKSLSYFIFDYVGIEVSEQGAVTLKGWTTFPWSATEFVKLAQAQPGVQKVDSKIQRVLITDTDRTLRLQVAELIYIRPKGPSFTRMNGPVHILVNAGVVTLAGTVERVSDIDGFERIVRSNTRAINVINGLQVKTQ